MWSPDRPCLVMGKEKKSRSKQKPGTKGRWEVGGEKERRIIRKKGTT